MHLERNAQGRRLGAARALFAACLLLLGASAALGQEATGGADAAEEFTVTDILKLPGVVVGRGANSTPRGLFKLRSYRVEEVALPRFTEARVRGERVAVNKAFRLTITGGPFPVRALPPVIWVDDVAVGYGVESEDLSEITAVTFDEALLRDGATISLSYGDKENKEGRTALPEKLKLDAKGGNR
jgi:hypothetical protein